MWLFTPDSFVSIVQHRDAPDLLLVRARFPGDLERLFPAETCNIEETPDADYRYRVALDREKVAEALAAAARDLRYANFKAEAAKRPHGGPVRMHALHQSWSALSHAQTRAHDDIPQQRQSSGADS